MDKVVKKNELLDRRHHHGLRGGEIDCSCQISVFAERK